MKSHGATDGFRGNQHKNLVSDHFGHLPKGERTRSLIAKQFGVGEGTVQRAEQFLDGLNDAEEVSPGFKTAILSGEVKACYERIWNKPAYKRGCWRFSPTTKSNKKVSSERVWDQPTHQESGW